MNSKVLMVVVVGGIVAVIAAGLLMQGEIASMPKADTDTVGYDNCGAVNPDIKGYGVFDDVQGQVRTRGEVFTQSTIYYSFEQDGRSQEIVGSGKVSECGLLGLPWIDWADYRFSIDNGDGDEPFYQDDVPNGFWRVDIASGGGVGTRVLGAFAWKVDGYEYCNVPTTAGCPAGHNVSIKDGAVLSVDMTVLGHRGAILIANEVYAHDELTLRNAIARVDFTKERYVVGQEPAIVTWRAPTATYQDCDLQGECTTRPAYEIEVVNRNTGQPIPGYERRPIPTAEGRFVINLTADMFSNDTATCENTLDVYLFTEIAPIDEDFTDFITASLVASAPAVKDVRLSSADIHEGDSVTITWTIEGAVTSVHLKVYISGARVVDVELEGDARSYTFYAAGTGVGRAWVSAERDCAMSGEREVDFAVGNMYPGLCTVYPEVCGGDGDEANLALVAIVAVGLAALTFLVVVLVGERIKLLVLRVLAAAFAAGIVGVVVYVIGAAIAVWVAGLPGG